MANQFSCFAVWFDRAKSFWNIQATITANGRKTDAQLPKREKATSNASGLHPN